MNLPRSVGLTLKAGLLGLLMLVCLGSEYLHRTTLPWEFLNQAQAEVFAAFQATDMQWLIVICISAYCFGFVWLNHIFNRDHPWRDTMLFCGVALYALGASAYALNYDQASKGTDVLVLLFGIALFFGFRFWRTLEGNRNQPFNIAGVVLAFTLILLSIAAVWHFDAPQSFQYRGQARWSGLWVNPNTFGMLMAVAVVQSAGLILSQVARYLLRSRERHLTVVLSPNEAKRGSGGKHPTSNVAFWNGFKVLSFAIAAVLCGIGLVKSYSRGAWVGALAALGYLAWSWRSVLECGDSSPLFPDATGRVSQSADKLQHSKLRRWFLPMLVITASVVVLAFWSFRHTERAAIRRVFSVGNANDFSWRNRVAAYEGALQMMADKPWFGFGWNQPEQVYYKLYQPDKLLEGMAIQLNDYFMLGMTLGLPALGCFLAYIWLSLMRGAECRVRSKGQKAESRIEESEIRNPKSEIVLMNWLKATRRAGATVLLVGFWFDGGLFKLATAAPFWILLELGRRD